MRTTKIELNSGAVMAPKKMTTQKILSYFAILFTSKFTDHVIAAKCPYDEIPGIFKRGNPFSGERGEKEILIHC